MRILYSYFRSSSSFRVRIALQLKSIACEYRYINLKPDISEQKGGDYLEINPQGRVPFFIDGDLRISQSPAILEYLEEAYPDIALLPKDLYARAKVRELVNLIACDIQPLNNISVLTKLKQDFSADQEKVNQWYHFWIDQGFAPLERLLSQYSVDTEYCFGNQPSLADVHLVPQVWNALRFDVPMESYPTVFRIYQHCMQQEGFVRAAPEQQSDCG